MFVKTDTKEWVHNSKLLTFSRSCFERFNFHKLICAIEITRLIHQLKFTKSGFAVMTVIFFVRKWLDISSFF